MELWARVDGQKVKFQGSFKKVMEDLLLTGKGKSVQLMSVHSSQKELRRFKRELRRCNKDLLMTARRIVEWYYRSEMRKTRRTIKELRKRARYLSKGQIFYCKNLLERIEREEKRLAELDKRLCDLITEHLPTGT